jgi:hypothetical protein
MVRADVMLRFRREEGPSVIKSEARGVAKAAETLIAEVDDD